MTRGTSAGDEHSAPCCPFPDWLSITAKTPQFSLKKNKEKKKKESRQKHNDEENLKTRS